MKKIISIIEKICEKSLASLTITDATANVGGSAINFALNARLVNIVEIDEVTFEILKNNLKVYRLLASKRVKLYNDDYTKIMQNLQQDVVFLDPPWGGLTYASNEKMQLSLGNMPITSVINEIKDNAKLIVMKIPFNFDKTDFEEKIKYTKPIYHSLKNFEIVTLLQP